MFNANELSRDNEEGRNNSAANQSNILINIMKDSTINLNASGNFLTEQPCDCSININYRTANTEYTSSNYEQTKAWCSAHPPRNYKGMAELHSGYASVSSEQTAALHSTYPSTSFEENRILCSGYPLTSFKETGIRYDYPTTKFENIGTLGSDIPTNLEKAEIIIHDEEISDIQISTKDYSDMKLFHKGPQSDFVLSEAFLKSQIQFLNKDDMASDYNITDLTNCTPEPENYDSRKLSHSSSQPLETATASPSSISEVLKIIEIRNTLAEQDNPEQCDDSKEENYVPPQWAILTCHICNQSCDSTIDLDEHIINAHPDQDEYVRCEELINGERCTAHFRLTKTYQLHLKIAHGVSEEAFDRYSTNRKYECLICGQIFRAPKQLSAHLQIHPELRKYTCHYCGRRFQGYSSVSIHRRTCHRETI